MALATGTRIGPYEVVGQLGAGGMGEVYRARDPRLSRDVALKVLPDSFANDSERLIRFQREAHVLASLKHPNIAVLYGIEEGTGQGGSRVRALVLELVEGETLAERIAQGRLPVREALTIARQIAEALESAHEQGVVHRDLKPANIRITPDGIVKVLDFGLAKLGHESGKGAQPTGDAETATVSPTLISPAMMTGVGMILGTAAYMAPEQAKGRPADKRSDIWAFGCVLFEMLTGVCPFKAEDVAETIALVLTKEPDWSLLPADTPLQIRRLLHRAMQKDRKRRLADAGDARIEIDDALALPERAATATGAAAGPMRPWWIAATVALVVLAALAASAVTWFSAQPNGPRMVRLTVAPAAGGPLNAGGDGRSVAIAPDGRRIVYRSTGGQLMIRPLDRLEPIPLSGLGGAQQPFISPDGESIGFFDGLVLKTVAFTGGPPMMLERLDGPGARGGSWGADNTIVFATTQVATGLQRIPAAGGSVEVLTVPDRARGELDHIWPSHLPNGRGILFTILPTSGDIAAAQIAVLEPDNRTYRILIRGGSYARYAASGHIVYLAGSDLRAVPFDVDSLEVTDDPRPPLQTGVRTTLAGAADFDIAPDGTLVYVAGGSQVAGPPRTLVWVDRRGVAEDVPPDQAPPRQYNGLKISPDGTRVALDIREQENDIWIWDMTRQTLGKLTFGPALDWWPAWTRDGQKVVYSSNEAGASNVYIKPADGSGNAERLTSTARDHLPTSVSPDGKVVVFDENNDTFDIMSVTTGAERQVTPLVQTQFDDRNGTISPDGRWFAYQSTESGQAEIYVRPYPGIAGGRWQVSSSGGTQPVWSKKGDELYYLTGGGGNRALMSVRVEPGAIWTAARPTRLFDVGFVVPQGPGFDVNPSGRFLFIRQVPGTAPVTGTTPAIVVVQNWFDELNRPRPPR